MSGPRVVVVAGTLQEARRWSSSLRRVHRFEVVEVASGGSIARLQGVSADRVILVRGAWLDRCDRKALRAAVNACLATSTCRHDRDVRLFSSAPLATCGDCGWILGHKGAVDAA